ncbi:hypothetical protein Scep_012531 [Stephania cephalantha]|uniref:Zinc finger CCCH domain-containing protein 18-like n=1 Tax=Stephania cephalantha TaxID=152367 RepID=A0AAP0JFB4_9MAGN
MDLSDATVALFSKIQKIDPVNVRKIMGYLLLQGRSDHDIVQLFHCPDDMLYSVVENVKIKLGLSPKPTVAASPPIGFVNSANNSDLPLQFTPFSPASSLPFSSPAVHVPNSYWDQQVVAEQQPIHNLDFIPQTYSNPITDEYQRQNQAQFLSLDEQLDSVNPSETDFSSNYYYPEAAFGSLIGRTSRRSPSLPEFPVKACHYFNKGFCKHGSSCRYFHGLSAPDGFPQVFSSNQNDLGADDHVFLPGTLEGLDHELSELLRCKGGPVSIASLPLMYSDRYGKNIQADGYLTESQRHGKAGYSLTKLLGRLRNIKVIGRPHGQHAIVLADEAPRYSEYRSEKNDPGVIVAGSKQIYLTFPAESTFTEEDVSEYFQSFGPVQDVRIPSQQKRMFGFVTFIYPETVKMILTKGNPHFVCGARVLVKPYKEKSRTTDRKYAEKVEPQMYFPSHYFDTDPELQPMPRLLDNSRLLRKQFMEEHAQAIELETRRLAELHLAQKSFNQIFYNYSLNDLKHSEGHGDLEYPSNDHFSSALDFLHNGSTSDDKAKYSSTTYTDQESQGLNLPESPFASAIASSISTVI